MVNLKAIAEDNFELGDAKAPRLGLRSLAILDKENSGLHIVKNAQSTLEFMTSTI